MEPKVYPDDRIGGSSRDDVICFSLSIVAGEGGKKGRLVDNPHVYTLIVSKYHFIYLPNTYLLVYLRSVIGGAEKTRRGKVTSDW